MFCSCHSFLSDCPRLRWCCHSSHSAGRNSSKSCTHMYWWMVYLPCLHLPPLKWKYFLHRSLKSSVSSQQTHICFQISNSIFPTNSLKDISPLTGVGCKIQLRHSASHYSTSQQSLNLMSVDAGPESLHVLSLKLSHISYPKISNWGKQLLLIHFL